MRRFPSLLTVSFVSLVSPVALTACGGSDGVASPAESAAPVETEAAPVVTEAATVETQAPAQEPTTEPVSEVTDLSGSIVVSLVEWGIETPTEIAAVSVTFEVSNGGDFAHHLAITRGNSYEELPQTAGGAIDEAALGDDFLGRTANLQSGTTATIEFDLEPGNYVLFCNIAGAVSHAAQGQVLSITAS